jgi:ABC-type bacteriocin/lantibiotic exporter with double-glycine peptidase domain
MIKVVEQINDGDCAIASLAMFLGRPYKTVLKEAKKRYGNPEKKGLWLTQIQALAKHFGTPVRIYRSQSFDCDEALGLLSVDNYGAGWRKSNRGKPEGHMVVIYKGSIIDPVGPSIWTPPDYKRYNKSKFKSMLLPRD